MMFHHEEIPAMVGFIPVLGALVFGVLQSVKFWIKRISGKG